MPKTTSHHHTHDHDHDHEGHDHSHAHTHADPQEDSVIGPNTIIPLTIPWANVSEAYQQVLSTLAKRVKTSGFRQGKVPTKIAEELIGFEKLAEETLKKVVPAVYEAALKAKDYKPLTQPEFRPLKLDKGSDWEIEAHIAEKPEVKVKGFEKLAKKGREEADKEIKEASKQGDKVQGTGDKAAGDKVDDKAAQEEKHKEIKLRHIFRELVIGLKPSIPELLVKDETRRELDRLVESLSQLNITFDDYLTRRQIDFNQLSAELATQVVSQLQLEFILEAISEDQKVQATDADFKPYLDRISDEKTRAKYLEDPEYRTYLTRVVSREKIITKLLAA